VAQAVIDAARAVLDLRDGLRAGVLALIRALAEAAMPDADRRARDRQLDDVDARRWSSMRRELARLSPPRPRRRRRDGGPARPPTWRSSTSGARHGGHASRPARARLKRDP